MTKIQNDNEVVILRAKPEGSHEILREVYTERSERAQDDGQAVNLEHWNFARPRPSSGDPSSTESGRGREAGEFASPVPKPKVSGTGV